MTQRRDAEPAQASIASFRILAWGRHPLAWCLFACFAWHLLVRQLGISRINSLADLVIPVPVPGSSTLRAALSHAMTFALFPGTPIGFLMAWRLRRAGVTPGQRPELDVLPCSEERFRELLRRSLIEATVALHLGGLLARAAWELGRCVTNGQEVTLRVVFPWRFGVPGIFDGSSPMLSLLHEILWHGRVMALHLVVLLVAFLPAMLRRSLPVRAAIFLPLALAWPVLKGAAYNVEDSLRKMGFLSFEPDPLLTMMAFDMATSLLLAWLLWRAVARLLIEPAGPGNHRAP